MSILDCGRCTKDSGFSDRHDCSAPGCLGWNIERNPKPIPTNKFDYDFFHDDHDGADGGNGLCGNASSYEDACAQIREIMLDHPNFDTSKQ